MKTPPRSSRCSALLAALVMFSAPAWSLARCPPEFGPKSPLVNAAGWVVVALGVVLGSLLFAVAVQRSRGVRWFFRAAVIVLGFAGMAGVSAGGLVLAVAFFFMRC
jgi:peptidoglycan/LPS O-acetylase OafA/YrhL